MSYTLRPLNLADHLHLLALMQATARYLARNPGLSFVAEVADEVVGCLMAGHDGRRGYLQHLLVLPAYRGQGIARALVDACLAALAQEGIAKSHCDVLVSNAAAQAFWAHLGWARRDDILRFSVITGGEDNA
ncbi:GNAT family N-acetyltransferase [Viridibacterium curvum]|uniref:N-acetyltransferase domain-containing protein n=1 Tax=Viridibacterium curvum TaxID=1101404 RepID=A0ABP9QRI2_9RHOO